MKKQNKNKPGKTKHNALHCNTNKTLTGLPVDPIPHTISHSVPTSVWAPTKARIERAINDLIEAAQNYSWKGSHPPSSHGYDEAWLKAAKLRLRLYTGVCSPSAANVRTLWELDGEVHAGRPSPTDEERGR